MVRHRSGVSPISRMTERLRWRLFHGPNYNGEFLPLISSATPNIIVMENIVKRWLQCKNSIQTIANYTKSQRIIEMIIIVTISLT